MSLDVVTREHIVRLMAGGDVMLGRGVAQSILRHGPDYPLAPVAALMREADLTLVNLECALTASTVRWPGPPKVFYFGAPPSATQTLTHAGVDLVSLANNHVLDFGVGGLRDTLRALHRHGIACAGAGKDIEAARLPAIVDCGPVRFGMAALCNHQADFAAQRHRPGIAYIDLEDTPSTMAVLEQALASLRRQAVDWPILSLHWGPNMVLRPSMEFRRIAHAAIEMGWKILFGHSAHVFQGIEIHQGCPIIYAAGDLVDDYQVDPEFRNDHQLLFGMELTRSDLQRICLHPVIIRACQTRCASGEQFEFIAHRMTMLSAELGTRVHRQDGKIWIEGTGN